MWRAEPVHAIPRVAALPEDVFLRAYVGRGRPVIMTGIVDRWPAKRLWSNDHIRERYGHLKTPVARLQQRCLGRDPTVGIHYEDVDVRTAVDLVCSGAEPGYYLSAPLEGPMKPILDEVEVPTYLRDAPRVRARFWLSAPDTVSPLHRDFPDNLFAQVVGRKRFTLLPPSDKRYVYMFSLRSRLPQISPVDAEAPDYARFPRFRAARPIQIDLGPGDLLYLPGRWWHQVRSLDASMSINWWWARGVVRWLAEAADVYKKLRGVRL